jgi:type VI secretion system secreted protein VgrG
VHPPTTEGPGGPMSPATPETLPPATVERPPTAEPPPSLRGGFWSLGVGRTAEQPPSLLPPPPGTELPPPSELRRMVETPPDAPLVIRLSIDTLVVGRVGQ